MEKIDFVLTWVDGSDPDWGFPSFPFMVPKPIKERTVSSFTSFAFLAQRKHCTK